MSIKQLVVGVAKVGVLLACAYYSLNGIDFGVMTEGFSQINLFWVAVYLVLYLVGYAVHGFRIATLCDDSVGAVEGVRCFSVGMAGNFLLPSKLGELVKVLYLNKACRLSGAMSTEVVFWERFFDVNTLLVLIPFAIACFGDVQVIVPFVIMCVVSWGGLFLVRRLSDGFVESLLRKVPYYRIRTFARDVVMRLRTTMSVAFFLRQGGWTSLVWLVNLLGNYVFLVCACGLPLGLQEFVYVTLFAVLGLSIPAAPGGLGVFEAAMVFSLGTLGVPREEALMASVVWHGIMFGVAIATSAAVFATSNLTLNDLCRKQQEAVSQRESFD